MGIFEISAILLSIAALLAWFNTRYMKLPMTIGLMILALAHSLLVMGQDWLAPNLFGFADWSEHLMRSIDFNETLMHGMLGFLLFAGALHVNINDLRQHKAVILLMATIGVVVTTVVTGLLTKLAGTLLGFELPWIYCFLFGALIAPTDPIAVLAILKTLGAPKKLETKIAGEALFNDGVGVVVFLALLGVAGIDTHSDHLEAPTDVAIKAPADQGDSDQPIKEEAEYVVDATETTVWEVAKLFVVEALGGLIFGLGLGFLGYWMIRPLDHYPSEILITLAMVFGGYALALELHVSGPIAMVVAGLLIGNHGRNFGMSETTRKNLDTFWELIDEILNAVLFVLIGLEVLVVKITGVYLLAGVVAIPVVLAARWVSVASVMKSVKALTGTTFVPHAIKVMTWAGLRGGISVALALSLKGGGDNDAVDAIIAMTYVVVAFSIIVQGLTMAPMMRKLGLTGRPQTD